MKISFFRVLLLVFLYFLCLSSKVSSEDIQCSFVGFSRNPGISGSLTITPNNITGEIKNLPIGNHSIVFHQVQTFFIIFFISSFFILVW